MINVEMAGTFIKSAKFSVIWIFRDIKYRKNAGTCQVLFYIATIEIAKRRIFNIATNVREESNNYVKYRFQSKKQWLWKGWVGTRQADENLNGVTFNIVRYTYPG